MKRLFILAVCCVCAMQAGAQEKPPRVTIETLFQWCTGNQKIAALFARNAALFAMSALRWRLYRWL